MCLPITGVIARPTTQLVIIERPLQKDGNVVRIVIRRDQIEITVAIQIAIATETDANAGVEAVPTKRFCTSKVPSPVFTSTIIRFIHG